MALSEAEIFKIRNVALHALREIFDLSKITTDWSGDLSEKLHRGIGVAVGVIDSRILQVIYEAFPDLDDNPLSNKQQK